MFSFQAMLDHIKHSIVSLQIAKNMAHPINGIYNGPPATASTSSSASGAATGSSNNIQAGGLKVPLEGQMGGKGELGDDEDDSATENGEWLLAK